MASGFFRRHVGSWLLVLVALLALGAFLLFERGRVTTSERTRREGQLFPAWRGEDLRELSLKVANEGELRLERAADQDASVLDVRMLAPVQDAEIDATMVDRLLSTLELSGYERKLEQEPAAFGEVLAWGHVSMGALRYDFELGGEASVPVGARYLRVKGQGVYVVGPALVADLTLSPHVYRSKQIVPYLSIALAKLEIQTSLRPQLTLARIDSVSFRIVENGVRASRTRIDEIWSALAETRIEDFPVGEVQLAEAKRAVHDPIATVILHPEEGAPAELRYGGACPGHPEQIVVERRFAGAELLGCVPKEAPQGFVQSADKLADRRLFALLHDEVEELSAWRGSDHFEVVREGTGFRRRTPDPRMLTSEELAPFESSVQFLFEERGVSVSAPKGAFVAVAKLRVLGGRGVLGAEAGLEEEVELGRCGVVPCARRKSDGASVQLEEPVFARLVPSNTWMRSSKLASVPEKIETIELRCGAPQRFAQRGASYELLEPFGLALDAPRTFELADQLRRLTVAAWITDGMEGFGFGGCTVRFGGLTLELGAESDDLVFARRVGEHAVFMVSGDLVRAAKRWYVQRSFWNAEEPPAWARVVRGSTTLGEWSSADADVDPALLALQDLRADEVLALGPRRADEGDAWLTVEMRRGARTLRLQLTRAANEEGARVRSNEVPASYRLDEPRLASLLQTLGVTDAGASPVPAPHSHPQP